MYLPLCNDQVPGANILFVDLQRHIAFLIQGVLTSRNWSDKGHFNHKCRSFVWMCLVLSKVPEYAKSRVCTTTTASLPMEMSL